jgi:hypothetical protein
MSAGGSHHMPAWVVDGPVDLEATTDGPIRILPLLSPIEDTSQRIIASTL